ncbi:MAG: Na+/H+ antiporter [Dermatophilaceae bacterium]
MNVAIAMLAMVATVTLFAGLARWHGLHAPLLLTVIGVAGSFLPFVPQVRLDPELVLVGLLPPLLYATAIRSSLIDFKLNRRAIGMLSVGLVAFTALGVGIVTWWILPVPFAAAFAFGAVVAPPDAVATTAVARRIGLPRRIVTILEGESLLNDATALVALSTAIAALSGTVSFGSISLAFLQATLGGLIAGLAVAFLIGRIRHRVTDSVLDTSLSFMAPFAAYLPAEAIHGSGVVAVVVTGLVLAHRGPLQQNAASRLSERVNWSTISFLLENTVFLLIGLQARWIVGDVRGSTLPYWRITLFCMAALAAVILLRPLWVFPVRYLIVRPGVDRMGRASPWTHSAIVSWAGPRGVVTLAAALVLPAGTPHREVLVMAAMFVTAATLLVQGISLPGLARKLDVRGPDPREDVLQEATVLQASVAAGIAELERTDPDLDPSILEALRARAQGRADLAWERLGRTGPATETPTEMWRRLRLQMLLAERAAVLEIRSAGHTDHEVIESVLSALDLEELMLDRVAADRDDDLREGWHSRPEEGGGPCEHLAAAPNLRVPSRRWACPECEREGLVWVHLRICLECGNVGCCSSSPGNHAERHFREVGHPVMRSFEPGEAWRWCYQDDLLG